MKYVLCRMLSSTEGGRWAVPSRRPGWELTLILILLASVVGLGPPQQIHMATEEQHCEMGVWVEGRQDKYMLEAKYFLLGCQAFSMRKRA